MTSDHRVAGSSPAGCTPQHQPLMDQPLHHMGNMLGHFFDTFQNRFLSHEPRYLPSESRAFGNTRPGKYRGSSSPNSVTQSGDPELSTQTRSRSYISADCFIKFLIRFLQATNRFHINDYRLPTFAYSLARCAAPSGIGDLFS